jgi:hypothetical protein
VVRAPSVEVSNQAPRVSAPPSSNKLTACALPWTTADIEEGRARVVVVCGSDVRRQDIEPGPVARAIDPALEPARERVCACASRMPAPAFVDIEVTVVPDDGQASIKAAEPDDELDADQANAFAACIGTVKATIARSHTDACGPEKAILVYPLRVDLAR